MNINNPGNAILTSLLSQPFSAASLSQSVSGVTAANLQTAAPQFASRLEFRILLPEASDIALADISQSYFSNQLGWVSLKY